MRYERSPLRPGMTAIAAVLALSSTPLLAQSTDVAPTTPSSVVTAPIAAPSAPAPVAAAPQVMSVQPATPSTDASSTLQPLAAPSTSLSTAAPTTSAPAASVPVVNAAPPPTATPEPAAAPVPAPVVARSEAPTAAVPVRSVRSTTATRSVERSTATRTAAPVTETTPAPAPAAAAVAPAPVPERQPLTRTAPGDELVAGDAILPVAGAAGVALLVLGGGFIALGRRRRRDEDYDAAPLVTEIPAEPVAATMVADRPIVAPVIATGPREPTVLSNGFDISRFGRHAQAAYRGPTPDNPSLSLKKRLRRASFYDQRERMAGMQPAMAPVEPRATRPEPAPAMAARTSDHIVVRPARQQPTARPPRGLRPAFQG